MMKFINIGAVMESFKRDSLENKIKAGEAKDVTQEEAQKIFENSEFDPSEAYAAFCNIIFTAVFFQPILPASPLMALAALIFAYYAFKKNLLRDCKRPIQVSNDIAEVSLYLLNVVPFVYGLSNVIFDKLFRGKAETASWFIMIAGIISIFYPLYLVFLDTAKDCIKEDRTTEQNYNIDYNQMRMRFLNEYDRANPITKEDATKDYFQYLKGSCFINDRFGKE